MPNRLIQETSPYLLQHAHNLVDWYPWGEEAFQRAKTENKPILLSIGYSACHWCHVMAHESFENAGIARQMNDNFINIKVDREERPDIDHVYMESVQAMIGNGGWPLTAFLTPEGKPFYGGTYFPPEDRRGLPGFPRVLKMVAEAYNKDFASLEQTTTQIFDYLSQLNKASTTSVPLTPDILNQAYNSLESCFDEPNGGFGGAPKFPNPLTLEFLLEYYSISGEKRALEMVNVTLEKMAAGGIYDQLGGGFHRYATDIAWQIPHFEKMLYDNALLVQNYLHAFLITQKPLFAAIARETLDYVLKEMRDPCGGFYCSQDADTDGEEGKYYLWTAPEIEEVLGKDLFSRVKDYWGITREGNFEGRIILHRTGLGEVPPEVREARRMLLEKRRRRNHPARDDKVLASWNGLLLSALAEASSILQRSDYQAAAISCGEFLRYTLNAQDGQLMHFYKDGQVRIKGFLEDYASVIEGFLALHQATLDARWLESAIDLASRMVDNFYDARSGWLYDSSNDQSDLFIRHHNDFDGAVPSGGSSAALVLLKIEALTDKTQYREIAEKAITSVASQAGQTPMGYSQWLRALGFRLSVPQEIVIIGDRYNQQTQDLARVVYEKWLPHKILVARNPAQKDSLEDLPLFKDRNLVDSQPTVYICRNNICQAPIIKTPELEKSLLSS
jgi:uncharacterized protein